jgi:hypothetical protein
MRAPTMTRRCPYCGQDLPPNVGFDRHFRESAECQAKTQRMMRPEPCPLRERPRER